MKEHAEHEEAGTLQRKSRVENDEATRRNARMPALPPFKPKPAVRPIAVNQKAGLRRFAKPALFAYQQIGTH